MNGSSLTERMREQRHFHQRCQRDPQHRPNDGRWSRGFLPPSPRRISRRILIQSPPKQPVAHAGILPTLAEKATE